MRPQLQILWWHRQRQNRPNDSDIGKTLRWFWSDTEWPVDPFGNLERDVLPQTHASDADPLFSLLPWSYRVPGLSPMRNDYGTGIPALLRSLRTMPKLEILLQSNYSAASEIAPLAAYLPIRPAPFTRWSLLACPFPLSIFSLFPIGFLFTDWLINHSTF